MRPSIPMTIAAEESDASVAEYSSVAMPMDEAVFRAFYQETAPMLLAYIRRASGDATLADDILQETFYRFLRANVPNLEQAQMKAYLYRTATSLLTDHWRRLKRERRWSLKTVFGKQTTDTNELGRDMMRLFERLQSQEQALLWLAYVEGFDHREIAAAMKLKEKSVRVLLFRVRKKMAAILTQQGFGPQGDL